MILHNSRLQKEALKDNFLMSELNFSESHLTCFIQMNFF